MATHQVRTYLEFVAGTCHGVFLSHNQDHHEDNLELDSVSALLREYFVATDITYGRLPAPESADADDPAVYRTYLCVRPGGEPIDA
jgi:hypothetical protein